MKIGLYNLEPKIKNTAMMKVSMYHKLLNDDVVKYIPLWHNDYDMIYCFSLFSWTKKPKEEFKKDMMCGGTGFDLKIELPEEIDELKKIDYGLYPECDCSYVWFSRGCIRKCPFCVVPEKEGYIKPVEPCDLNPRGKYINIMDNNFFANPEWRGAVEQIRKWNQSVDFQAMDVRLLDPEKCEILNSIPLASNHRIHIAWDLPKQNLVPKLKEVIKYIMPYKFMCYVLVGFNSTFEEDAYRVRVLRDLGIDPFIMVYNKKGTKLLKEFARWCNRFYFRNVSFKTYLKARGYEKLYKGEDIK